MARSTTLAKLALAAGMGAASIAAAALPAGARDVPVQDRLLSAVALGTGWRTESITTKAALDNAAGCYAHPLAAAKGATTAAVKFIQTGGMPQLVEEVLVPTGSASSAYHKVTQALAKCVGSQKVNDSSTATISSLTIPSIGPNVAYQIALTSNEVNESQMVVIAPVGRYVLDLSYANTGPLQLTQVENYAHLAISRLGGSPG